MWKLKGIVLCLFGMLLIAPAAQADFTMNNIDSNSTGSGEATGGARVSAPDAAGSTSFDSVNVNFDLDDGASAYIGSYAEAIDGTASASASGDLTNTETVNGDTVTAAIDGDTSATARREEDVDLMWNRNYALSSLQALVGTGTTDTAEGINTQTGFLFTNAHTEAGSTGSDDAGEPVDATASSSGTARAGYQFQGSRGPETASVDNADVNSTADVEEDSPQDTGATSFASALSLVRWTDEETFGQSFYAQVGITSLSGGWHNGNDGGAIVATANAAADVDLNFTYRPIANPSFSFIGNANGSTDSEAQIYENDAGSVYAYGTKAAVGHAGTATDNPAIALAWIVGNVEVNAEDNNFEGSGTGHAVNPAVLGESDFDPDPSMSVTTQYGTFSAAMGSSSLVNAEVLAQITTVEDDVTNPDIDLDAGENAIATAFGFAQAAYDQTATASIGTPGVTLFNVASENAFVGVGSITASDEADGDDPLLVRAVTYNLFGSASSPSYSGTVDNADSFSSIYEDENGVYQRMNSASADSVTGTNFPIAISHNEYDGTFEQSAAPILPNGDVPWWSLFGSTEGPFEHVSGAIIGGGGD